MKGKVKFFNVQKGFGFIAGDDGKEYFVHSTGLGDGVKLFEDDTVEFEVEEGERGPKAVSVKKSSEGSDSGSSDDESAEDDFAEAPPEEGSE